MIDEKFPKQANCTKNAFCMPICSMLTIFGYARWQIRNQHSSIPLAPLFPTPAEPHSFCVTINIIIIFCTRRESSCLWTNLIYNWIILPCVRSLPLPSSLFALIYTLTMASEKKWKKNYERQNDKKKPEASLTAVESTHAKKKIVFEWQVVRVDLFICPSVWSFVKCQLSLTAA